MMTKSSQRRIETLVVGAFMAALIGVLCGCGNHVYDPYEDSDAKKPAAREGRQENRSYPISRADSPPPVVSESTALTSPSVPAGLVAPPPPPMLSFPDKATYQLGPGDVLEIIYQLKAVQRTEPYRLAIQDEVDVTFMYTPAYNRKTSIRTDGKVRMPMIGDVEFAGKTTDQVETELLELYAKILKDPIIQVNVTKSNLAIEELKRAITTAPRGQSRLEPVRPDGHLSLPLIGDVLVGGLTVPSASQAIVDRYRALGVEDIDVTVVLLEVHSPVAYIMGEVAKPGPLVLSAGPYSLWQVIGEAGGFGPSSDRQHVIVSRTADTGEQRFVKNFEAWRVGGEAEQNMAVHRGDLIYVPKLPGRFVYLMGEVEKPGPIALDTDTALTATQAVAMGGRLKPSAKHKQVLVLRKNAKNDPIIIEVNLKDVFDTRNYNEPEDHVPRDPALQPGDIVYVPPSKIGNFDRFAEAYFRDGIWTVIPFNFNVTYSLN